MFDLSMYIIDCYVCLGTVLIVMFDLSTVLIVMFGLGTVLLCLI